MRQGTEGKDIKVALKKDSKRKQGSARTAQLYRQERCRGPIWFPKCLGASESISWTHEQGSSSERKKKLGRRDKTIESGPLVGQQELEEI